MCFSWYGEPCRISNYKCHFYFPFTSSLLSVLSNEAKVRKVFLTLPFPSQHTHTHTQKALKYSSPHDSLALGTFLNTRVWGLSSGSNTQLWNIFESIYSLRWIDTFSSLPPEPSPAIILFPGKSLECESLLWIWRHWIHYSVTISPAACELNTNFTISSKQLPQEAGGINQRGNSGLMHILMGREVVCLTIMDQF